MNGKASRKVVLIFYMPIYIISTVTFKTASTISLKMCWKAPMLKGSNRLFCQGSHFGLSITLELAYNIMVCMQDIYMLRQFHFFQITDKISNSRME